MTLIRNTEASWRALIVILELTYLRGGMGVFVTEYGRYYSDKKPSYFI
jgi:hypothetical protein